MREPIPGKGAVLTALSRFWFERTAELVPNHLLGDAPPPELAERALVVRKAERIDVECVVRGYLAGSGWVEYARSGTLAGEALPSGLRESQQLPRPRFTPATKAESGHDENISRAELRGRVGDVLAEAVEAASLCLYAAGAEHARRCGLILADTMFEFGFIDGRLTLIDELMTPDSSRYRPLDGYAPGKPQPSFDKQFLRDFLLASGWNREPPAPPLPPDIIEKTTSRYHEAFRRLTGRELAG